MNKYYYSILFKKIIIIIIRKSEKFNYIKFNIYQLIVLKNILKKILENIIIKFINYFMKIFYILSIYHFEDQTEKIIEDIIITLSKKIYEI